MNGLDLCFLAGAGRIFRGDKLLTFGNVGDAGDNAMFEKLGLASMKSKTKPETQGKRNAP